MEIRWNMPLDTKHDTKVEKAHICTVCNGLIKPWSMVIKCGCGKLYHETCATRVKTCIMCNRVLVAETQKE